MTKVFGIGLMRTGTTSLAEALRLLGFDAIHATCEADIHLHEAATDTPVACRFRQLDGRYPDAKFILTVREANDWIASCRRHWSQPDWRERQPPTSQAQYRTLLEYTFARGRLGLDFVFNEATFREVYTAHNTAVLRWFDGRIADHDVDLRGDLLVFDVNQGWEPFCWFLERSCLKRPFPHLNKGK